MARQTRPYRPLTEATADQAVCAFEDLSGTLVGFRSPDYAQGLTVAGYHLHFIDDSRTRGGHVLDFTLDTGTLQLDLESGIHLELPETEQFERADLAGHDLAAETARTEGS